MSKNKPAYVYGQESMKRKADKHCKVCGRPIYYGKNGAQMLDTCIDCYRPNYTYSSSPIRKNVDWDELDAMEDRCLGDDVD